MITERYFELLEKDGTNPSDNERKALFTIFSGNNDLYSKVNSLYDFQERMIKSDCFSKVDLSSGAYQLVKLAFNLYNSNNEGNITDILSSLDNENYNLAIKAIHTRFNKI